MYHLIFELIGLAMNNRTKRLLYLIERDFEGSQTKFARAINRSNTQVNALVRERKSIGDVLALHIAKTLNLHFKWFAIPIEKIENQVNQITNKTGTNISLIWLRRPALREKYLIHGAVIINCWVLMIRVTGDKCLINTMGKIIVSVK